MGEHIELLAHELAAAGVTHAFGVAGSGASYALISALAEQGVAYQPVAHEGAAAIMAGAACRRGDLKAVAVSIKGPGFANLVPGIVSNRYESRPAMTVSEAYPPGAPLSAQHKRMDHRAALVGIAKGVGYAGSQAHSTRCAVTHAVADDPGPVHIELCPTAVERDFESFGEVLATPHANALGEVLEIISAARRPALLLGAAAARLADPIDWAAAGVPVATTAAAKGAIDETSPWAAGVATGETGELSPETRVLAEADLVIGVGLRNREMVRSAPFSARCVLVDCVGGDVHEGFSAECIAVVDDLRAACAAVVAAAGSAPAWGRDLIAERNEQIRRRLAGGWLPSNVFWSLEEHAADAVLVLDTGLFCIVGEAAWHARSPELFCGSSVGRFMGTGIPTALGIAVAEGRPVAAVVGDGGARPYLPELRIAAEHGLPLLVAVVSDGRFGTIALSDPVGRLNDPALSTGGLDWARVGEALGLEATRVSSPEAADAVVAGWSASPRPLLLEAAFDPAAYISMVEGLR